MKKYTPRVIFYTACPIAALALIPISPESITSPLMSNWFCFLAMTLYFRNDKIAFDKAWLRNIGTPKKLFNGIIYIGLIGLIFSATSNIPYLSYIFMPFIFVALECLFRMHEEKLDMHRNIQQ